jgi:hypothetical protein
MTRRQRVVGLKVAGDALTLAVDRLGLRGERGVVVFFGGVGVDALDDDGGLDRLHQLHARELEVAQHADHRRDLMEDGLRAIVDALDPDGGGQGERQQEQDDEAVADQQLAADLQIVEIFETTGHQYGPALLRAPKTRTGRACLISEAAYPALNGKPSFTN